MGGSTVADSERGGEGFLTHAAEARLRSRLAEVEQEKRDAEDVLATFADDLRLVAECERERAERAEAERDRAIETRENANAVSVRVEIENRQLRERVERAEAALREIMDRCAQESPQIGAIDRAFHVARRALAPVPSSLDDPKEPWEVLRDAPSVTDLACECENPVRESYTGRDGLRHCWQCDGRVDAPKEQP